MRVLIDILHPAHVHFFRNLVQHGQQQGHEFLITARDKEMSVRLLDAYGLDYRLLTRQRRGSFGLATELAQHTALVAREARRFKPHLMLGIMAPCIALAGLLSPARVIAFYDNESACSVNQLVYRLCDAYVAPNGFRTAFGDKLIRYPGYHELAYLHPRWFQPDPGLLANHGIDLSKRLFFVRFVGWWSSHDRGERGFSPAGKRELIKILAQHGQVIISSEAPLPPELQRYNYRLPPEIVHQVLAQADLFVGESSTMASEACILGTHSVYVSRTGRGINDEQVKLYRHAEYYIDTEETTALRRIKQITLKPDTKALAIAERVRLLHATIDQTDLLLRFLDQQNNQILQSDSTLPSQLHSALSNDHEPPPTKP